MKRILALSVLFLVIPALALAGSTVKLPDFEKEAKVTDRLTCSNGSTQMTLYETKSYDIEVTVMKSGNTFYLLFDDKDGQERFFMKTSRDSSVLELSHEEWDKKVRAEDDNYFNNLHKKSSDCKRVK